MNDRPPCYPDLTPRKQIREYLHEQTGMWVTEQRIGRWITLGEIRMISVPCRGGYKWFTRRAYLAELVEKYTYGPVPPKQPGRLWIPRVPEKPKFHFPRRQEAPVDG
jgi:hypothetical protein